jgi:hypothetical protein
MQYGKVTKIAIREDMPTALTSSRHGANLDTVGFNIKFILEREPNLAVEIFKLYDQARQLRPDDPMAPEEDYRLAGDRWSRFLDTASKDQEANEEGFAVIGPRTNASSPTTGERLTQSPHPGSTVTS